MLFQVAKKKIGTQERSTVTLWTDTKFVLGLLVITIEIVIQVLTLLESSVSQRIKNIIV